MKIAVMGAGGVGGYFGARLAAAGHAVTFIARGAHLDAIRAHGLLVHSELGDVELPSAKATNAPSEVGLVDVVLFAVKLWDTESAAKAIAPLVGPATMVLSLQNGVQKDELLERLLGPQAVVGGLCYISAAIERPGVIRQTGTMQKLVFGDFDEAGSERVRAFYDACRDAHIDAEISRDIRRAIWEKFVFLVGLSACTASIRQPVGVIRANTQTRALLLDIMREVVAVGRTLGVALDPDYAEQRLSLIDGLPAEVRASMAVDLERGNRLEIPWLSGGVVTLGERCGEATPVNKIVAAMLSPYVNGAPTLPATSK